MCIVANGGDTQKANTSCFDRVNGLGPIVKGEAVEFFGAALVAIRTLEQPKKNQEKWVSEDGPRGGH